MSRDGRGMAFDREGERQWKRLRAAWRLGPGTLRALVVADRADVRNEIRRRLAGLGIEVHRVEPSDALVERIHALAEGDAAPLVWVEGGDGGDADGWGAAVRELNRERDRIGEHGPVSLVLAGPHALHLRVQESAPDLHSVLDPIVPLSDTLEPLALCWLHLSDLHLEREDWEQDIVLDALVRDLPGSARSPASTISTTS